MTTDRDGTADRDETADSDEVVGRVGGDRVEFRENVILGPVTGIHVERRYYYPPASSPIPEWKGSPYRGLAPFGEADARVFYGREQVTSELAETLAARLDGLAMLVVTGPSGAGKSSLLRAGLLPYLAGGNLTQAPDSAHWPRLVMTPAADPLTELALQLAALSRADPVLIRRSLAERPDQAHLLFRQALLARTEEEAGPPGSGASQGRVVVVVDQFEELFTLGSATVDMDPADDTGARPGRERRDPEREEREETAGAEARAFVTALRAAAGTPVGPARRPAALIVIGVRGDFWDRCAAFPPLVDALRAGPFTLAPMGEPELRRAIIGPAARAGLTLEDGLADLVLGDLRALASARRPEGKGVASAGGPAMGAGVLPLLSQAMLLTWQHREERRLTSRGYGVAGGIASVVQASAEAAYQQLTEAQRDLARQLFQQLTVITPGGHIARRRLVRTDLLTGRAAREADDLETVLRVFTRQRLVVADGDSVEMAHDLLLTTWPRLADWLEPDVAGHILYGQLLDDADEWDRHDRDPSFLYLGVRLAAANQMLPRWEADAGRYPLEGGPRRFLEAAAHADRRTTRRRRAVLTTLVSLLTVAVLAAVSAVVFAADVNRKRIGEISQDLAARSETTGKNDPVLASLLAVMAWRIDPTPEARNSLLTALRNPDLGALTHGDRVLSVDFSPDGGTLATAGADGTVRLWNATSRRQLGAPLSGHSGAVHSVVFSPDGRKLASAGDDRTLRLWDVGTGRQIGTPLTGHTAFVVGVAFSPDGSTLATTGADRTVRLWDVGSRRQLGAALTGHTDGVIDVDFSPDGRTLATSGVDQTVRLWDLSSRRRTSTSLKGHKGPVNVVAFSPDGRTLASAGDDRTVRLWDVGTGRQIGTPLTGHTDAVNALKFDPHGRSLATGGSEGAVRLWDVLTRRPLGLPLGGHTGSVIDLAFDPDGGKLATASVDHTVRLWNVSPRGPLGAPLTGHDNAVIAVAFSPDGRIMATGSTDRTVRLWDVRSRRPLGGPLTGHAGSVNAVAFSPDGGSLATAGADGAVRLWDVRSRRQLGAPLTGHTESVFKVVFAPDGRTLATGSVDRTVRLWDVRSRRQLGAPLTGHTDSVHGVAFSPDGEVLASTSGDQTVRLWDVRSRRPLGTPLTGHAASVIGVAFSPDGSTLATTSGDQTVRLWEVSPGRRLGAPLIGHTASVIGVAFSPDGSTLATTSGDRTVRLWNVSRPPDLVAAACALAGRSFTRAEWERYARGEAFQDICRQG